MIEATERRNDICRRALALDLAGREDDLQARETALDHMKDVADGGAGGGGDETDAFRESGQRAFAVGVEQALGLQLQFEPFKRGLERADALGLGMGHAELVLTARFIHGEFPAEDHPGPVAQDGSIQTGLAAE